MSRPTGVMKTSNLYAQSLDWKLYRDTPKAVFAAIAVSFAQLNIEGTGGNGTPEEIEAALLDEWQTLHDNGIIPQRPPRRTS